MREILKIIQLTAFLLIYAQTLMAVITFSPSPPNIDQQVTFTVTHPDGISQGSVLWNFGDGTLPIWNNPTIFKVFERKGIYTVSASYRTLRNQDVMDTVSVTVVERRKVSFSPLYPIVNTPVTFRAENFISAVVDWDFGDGTFVTGGTSETHTYTSPGIYMVAAMDLISETIFTAAVRVSVKATGPGATFQIYFVQLRFDDGKSYKIVPKDFSPLHVYADIKYEGTGILRAQWMLDGAPLGIITRALPFARQITIDTSEIMSLPTITPGIHEVSLKVIEPPTENPIPAIRFYVALRKPEIEKVDLSLTKVTGLDKTEITINGDYIEAPAEKYFLLKGVVRSEVERNIPYVLMRVYLNNELVDQKMIENLKPNEKIEFETSIYNATPGLKRIYLTFYDISRKPPLLLSVRRYILQPKEKR
ncbi:MAG: PKD domain-containing protein [Candidatus Aminicenantes bacterium]|nr:PKD domain-containing protein [Candidatus Aminicenantes bacterium]